MGLLNFIKGQLIEVIEWTDTSSDTMVYSFPTNNHEIKMGAQLTVRESQAAVFVNEGKIADVFPPGRHELATQNMPLLTKICSWPYGFNSPFKADVYFVNTKQFTDRKWGTANPIMMRDQEFGMLRLRAFGIYSFKVSDPAVFLKEVFGTSQHFDTASIEGQLKRSIVSGVTDLIGELKVPAIDLAGYYDELSEQAQTKLQPAFEKLGLQISSFYVENISLPEEVEKVLDKRTSMGVLGNMHQYAQYQTAEAIRDVAQHPGEGFAGAGVGFGAGAAIGNMMGNMFRDNIVQPQTAPQQPIQTQPQNVSTITCPSCKASVPAGTKFCSECGGKMEADKAKCIKCGFEMAKGMKFCPECGSPQAVERKCSGCGANVDGQKFCPECGTKVE